jgi:hypothetical protein
MMASMGMGISTRPRISRKSASALMYSFLKEGDSKDRHRKAVIGQVSAELVDHRGRSSRPGSSASPFARGHGQLFTHSRSKTRSVGPPGGGGSATVIPS